MSASLPPACAHGTCHPDKLHSVPAECLLRTLSGLKAAQRTVRSEGQGDGVRK